MKALVGAFNQEKALVGAFSVIVKTGCGTDAALHSTSCCWLSAHNWATLKSGLQLRATGHLLQLTGVRAYFSKCVSTSISSFNSNRQHKMVADSYCAIYSFFALNCMKWLNGGLFSNDCCIHRHWLTLFVDIFLNNTIIKVDDEVLSQASSMTCLQ